jgi:hypothetical protein
MRVQPVHFAWVDEQFQSHAPPLPQKCILHLDQVLALLDVCLGSMFQMLLSKLAINVLMEKCRF